MGLDGQSSDSADLMISAYSTCTYGTRVRNCQLSRTVYRTVYHETAIYINWRGNGDIDPLANLGLIASCLLYWGLVFNRLAIDELRHTRE